MQRRRTKPTESLDERLAQQARQIKEWAKALPSGKERQEMIRKARQAETALRINQWISSSGLRKPE
jgi:transposase